MIKVPLSLLTPSLVLDKPTSVRHDGGGRVAGKEEERRLPMEAEAVWLQLHTGTTCLHCSRGSSLRGKGVVVEPNKEKGRDGNL